MSKVNVTLYSASSLMRYRFPYVGPDLRYLVLQPNTSLHCITRCACLLIQFSLIQTCPQRAGSGGVDMGAWFCAEVVCPSKDGHLFMH